MAQPILIGIFVVLLIAFFTLHWRRHPQATALESLAALEALVGKRPFTLIQFYAPL
jgi:hypothetical protein